MSTTVKLTSRGQIALPKEDNKIVIKPAQTLREFKGVLKGHGKAIDQDQVRERVKEYRGEKAAHGGRNR